ncbi:hypothetical protein BGX21_009225 [Mortierella sp. AD011]|nr:hypothetical protein BGX20_009784 [Mortierella sp. AD010]KAF9403859.1 hypothetical protein BGX21_009225 [Mortierella sp. AD011]
MSLLFKLPWKHGDLALLATSSTERWRTKRRVFMLFAIVVLLSSGSLLVLHLTTPRYTSSKDPYSSSSMIRWSSSRLKNDRWDSLGGFIEEEDEANDVYLSNNGGRARPRQALPSRRPISNDREQILMRQQLELQDRELKRLRELAQDRRKELLSQQQGRATPDVDSNADHQQSPQLIDSENDIILRESAMAPRPFEETLRGHDDVSYLTYLPYAGITNQFYGMLRGMEVAKALNRTLIIPPITSSSHDKSKQNQPWSKFLDLKQFSKVTGIQVVEFHELRDAELTRYNELKCRITCGFGSKRTIDFTAKGFLAQWRLNATLGPLPVDDGKLETILTTLEPLKNDKYICLSNTYKIAVKDKSEWERFGQHLRFTSELEGFVQQFLDSNLIPTREPELDPVTGKRTSPPRHRYIAIHVRRGDFAKYCENNFGGSKLIHCLPSTEQIGARVDHIQKRINLLMDPSKMLPVFVATNEQDPEELKKFANLGWQYLDHAKMGTVEVLGVFGPMMVDQVFIAQAEAMIGIQMSTFSRVGALRQRDWEGREAEYM